MGLKKLYSIISKRIKLQSKKSYVVSLYKQGEDKILQKIGEEAVETIIAAKNKNKKFIIEEIADLFFMILVILAAKNITLREIEKELEKRRKK